MLALIPTDWIKMVITDILRPFEEYDILLSPTVCLWDNFPVRLIWDLKTEAPDGISDYKVGTRIFVRGIMSTRAKSKVSLEGEETPQAELDMVLIVHQIESLDGTSLLATVKRSKRRRLYLDIIETRYSSAPEQKIPLEEPPEKDVESEPCREGNQQTSDQEDSDQEQNETLEDQDLENEPSEEVNDDEHTGHEEQKGNEEVEGSTKDLVEYPCRRVYTSW
ncbi:hypothetical protein BGX26_005074 [Mortierella sp. AD094]|nr:hypothetical protein BGX26_005074 [Mortierella sp. AD094]